MDKIYSLFYEINQDYDEYFRLKEEKQCRTIKVTRRKTTSIQTEYNEDGDPERLNAKMNEYKIVLDRVSSFAMLTKAEIKKIQEVNEQRENLIATLTVRKNSMLYEKAKLEKDCRKTLEAYEIEEKVNRSLKEEYKQLKTVHKLHQELKKKIQNQDQASVELEKKRVNLKKSIALQQELLRQFVEQLEEERKKSEVHSKLTPCVQSIVLQMQEIMPNTENSSMIELSESDLKSSMSTNYRQKTPAKSTNSFNDSSIRDPRLRKRAAQQSEEYSPSSKHDRHKDLKQLCQALGWEESVKRLENFSN